MFFLNVRVCIVEKPSTKINENDTVIVFFPRKHLITEIIDSMSQLFPFPTIHFIVEKDINLKKKNGNLLAQNWLDQPTKKFHRSRP